MNIAEQLRTYPMVHVQSHHTLFALALCPAQLTLPETSRITTLLPSLLAKDGSLCDTGFPLKLYETTVVQWPHLLHSVRLERQFQ